MIAAMCVPEGFSFGSCSMAGRKKSATGISSVGATGVIRFRSILSSAASEVAADSRSDAQRGSLKVAACILGALLLREIGRELLCGIRPTQGAGTAFRGKGIGYSNARVPPRFSVNDLKSRLITLQERRWLGCCLEFAEDGSGADWRPGAGGAERVAG